jgi:hypothetical protein
MTDRPTDAAMAKFKQARLEAIHAGFAAAKAAGQGDTGAGTWVHLANAQQLTAEGLMDLATGIRAVYILLEKVQNSVRH